MPKSSSAESDPTTPLVDSTRSRKIVIVAWPRTASRPVWALVVGPRRSLLGSLLLYLESALAYIPTLLTDRTHDAQRISRYGRQGGSLPLADGNTVVYTRDANLRLTKLTDVHGRTVQFTYDAQGHVASIQDNAGNHETFAYGPNSDMTQLVDVDGDMTQFAYDAGHNLTQITYPNGGVRTYTYDAQGRVQVESDDNGNNQLTYAYTLGASTNAIQTGTTRVTDALGHVTRYDWQNLAGLPLTTVVTDPAGGVKNIYYTIFGLATGERDQLGRLTQYTVDNQGNRTSITDPAGGTSQAAYEPVFNQVTSMTDPKGNKTTLTYDGAGDLVQSQDPGNNFTLLAYDKQGHVTATKDPLGHVDGFSYDANGGLASATDPLGRTENMTRDPLSRLLQSVDAAGHQTNFSYDPAGNTTQVKDALNNLTNYSYQPGRGDRLLHQLTDANNHSTTFGYDVVGRQTSVTNALNQSSAIAYDNNGNPVTLTTKNGQTITSTYDTLNRVTRISLPEGNIDYTYDAAGNLLTATKYNGTALAFTYDNLTRVTQEIQTLPNGFHVTLNSSYDAAGNRTSLTTPWGTFRYTYDSLNRMTSVTNPYNQMVSFTYDAAGRRASKTYPNGTQTTYAYDAAGQVTQVMNRRTADNSVISFDNYVYDAAGNRTSVTDQTGTNVYGYDALNRLTSAMHPTASSLPVFNETFNYDGVGNRSADAVRTGYTYDATNRLVQDSSFTYTYDGNGNRLTKVNRATNAQTSYSFDSASRLIQVVTPDGGGGRYQYNTDGRRVERSTGPAATQTTSRYVYDGSNIVAILDASNSLLALFTNGPSIDEPLIMRRGGTDFFYHQDALRSVVALTDGGANVVETVEYEAYGLAVIKDSGGGLHSSSTVGNPYLFTAREWDGEGAEYFYRNRQTYDPDIGRFSQEDPLGFSGGVNFYSYASNQPTNRTDPLGLQAAGGVPVPGPGYPYPPPNGGPPSLPGPGPAITPPAPPAQGYVCKDRGKNKGQDKGDNYILEWAKKYLQDHPDEGPICKLLKAWYDNSDNSAEKKAIDAARKFAHCK